MGLEKSMERHVEKWKDSGLSKAQYASQSGISYNKLGYWARKLNRGKGDGKFLPVGIPEGKEKIEIQLPNKIIIKVPAGSLKRIIPELLEISGC